MNLHSLKSAVFDHSRELGRQEGMRDAAAQELAAAREEAAGVRECLERARGAHHLLQVVAERMRERLKGCLEESATRGLRYVFQRDYKVEFRVGTRHGQVAAECWVSEGGVSARARDGHGGGLADVLAFMLRVAALRSSGRRQVLLADEPFKFVNSPDAMERVKELLAHMARVGVQTVFVSSRGDLEDVEGARVFRMERGGRVTPA